MATVTSSKRHLVLTSDTYTSNGDVVVGGDLTIQGTTTTLDTANLLVEDKNIIIGNVSSPSDTTADGGGITLKGASDKTISWSNANNRWDFNQGITSSGDITAANISGSTSGTNTGDQTLPTDFVSAANGGTFAGSIQVDKTLSVGGGDSRFIFHSGASTVTGSGTSNATEIDWKDSTHIIPSLAYAFRVKLVVQGTGTDTGASYIVYYNNTTSAWVVRHITLAGTTSNHAQLTMVSDGSGTYMAAYHTHSGGYSIRYWVETFDSGDQDMDGHAFGSDFQWQRSNDTLTYADGNVSITNGNIAVSGTVDGVDISALPTSFAPTDAEANVQADWDATTGDALILNKPTIPTVPDSYAPTDAEANVQADWTETTNTSDAFILNKPTTFTPAQHTQLWSTITSTPTTLAGYGITDAITAVTINTYWNRGYKNSHQASNLPVGWYTIATNTGDRALAQFQIWDTASSDHQSVLFNASHHFGTTSSNDITVTANSRFSGTNFRYIRIKELGTYDGAALQVYVDGASNSCNVAIVGGNAQVSGWVIKDWVADATDPGDLTSYSSFTVACSVDLDFVINGGYISTGDMYIKTDKRVMTYAGGTFSGDILANNLSGTNTGDQDLSGYLPLSAGSTKKLTDALYIQGTNTTNAETVLVRGISSNDGDWLGSIRTSNTGGYNQEMRFYTSNANGTSDEDLNLTLKPDGTASFAGNIVMAANATVDGVDISGLPTSFAPTNAEQNVQSDWNATSGDALILNKPSIPAASGKGQNIDYVQSNLPSSNSTYRDNFGAGVWAYSGYSTGSDRPTTYDATLQVMPTANFGFEISTGWHSTGEGKIKIRALRDCCEGWGSYYNVWTSADFTPSSFISATSADTAAELITFSKGISSDGNAKFYNWRALDNTSGGTDFCHRIARITGTQSTRFVIEIAGRQSSYSDNSFPAFGKIVGQLNNDNNYDITFYNFTIGTSVEAVLEVGQLDVNTTTTDIYIRHGQFAELTATAHISDGTITTYSNDSGSTGTPSGYVQASESEVWNSSNDGSGSGMDADKVDGIHASSFLRSDANDTASGTYTFTGSAKFALDSSFANSEVRLPATTSQNPTIMFYRPTGSAATSYPWRFQAGGGGSSSSFYIGTGSAANNGAETIANKLSISSTGTLTVTGDVVAYGSPSDAKYKENVKPIENALDKVMVLEGVSFDWKENSEVLDIKEDIGFIAQDVQKVIPELVRENEDGNLSLRYQGLIPVLLEAMKEQQKQINELKSQMAVSNKKACNCKK